MSKTSFNLPITRRGLIRGAAAGGALLAMPQLMTRAAFAEAPMLGKSLPEFVRVKLGDFEITTINDGVSVREGPQPLFGKDQPPEDMAALMAANDLPNGQIALGFAPTIVNTGSELVLFDTGLGAGARGGGLGQLRPILAKAGYTPEQIDVVAITHMHPDHIGGLMEDGQPAFPNARYVAGQVEYDFWSNEDRLTGPTENVAKMVQGMVTPLAEKMTFIGDGGEVVSGITGMAAFGHTPGHMIYNIESQGKRVVLTGDTANHFVIAFQRPEWGFGFDAIPEMAVATRKRVLDMIATDNVPFIGYHMPFPAIGYVEATDTAFRYVAHSYQLTL